jgi:hypothetical protein
VIGVALPENGRSARQSSLPVRRSKARIWRSKFVAVPAAMKRILLGVLVILGAH